MRYKSYGYLKASNWTPGVKFIIIANTAVFGLQILILLLDKWVLKNPIYPAFQEYFALHPHKVINNFHLWQLISSAFLHSLLRPFHIVFNLITVYFFGYMMEKQYGTRRFLYFYFFCAVFAGLCYTFVDFIQSNHIAMVGASGAIMGVLVVVACLAPKSTVYFNFIFPMSLKTLVWILLGINLYMAIIVPDNDIAVSAHLGGMLFGYIYYRYSGKLFQYLEKIEYQAKIENQRRDSRKAKKKMKTYEEIREEVDRLLDKIHKHGLHSLSGKEREFLQQASKEYQRNLHS